MCATRSFPMTAISCLFLSSDSVLMMYQATLQCFSAQDGLVTTRASVVFPEQFAVCMFTTQCLLCAIVYHHNVLPISAPWPASGCRGSCKGAKQCGPWQFCHDAAMTLSQDKSQQSAHLAHRASSAASEVLCTFGSNVKSIRSVKHSFPCVAQAFRASWKCILPRFA